MKVGLAQLDKPVELLVHPPGKRVDLAFHTRHMSLDRAHLVFDQTHALLHLAHIALHRQHIVGGGDPPADGTGLKRDITYSATVSSASSRSQS